jgi:hypothetical protein
MGPPPAANLREKGPIPGFQNSGETATAPYDLGTRRERLGCGVTLLRGLAGPNVYTVLEKFAPMRGGSDEAEATPSQKPASIARSKQGSLCHRRKMLLKAAYAGRLIGAAFRTGHYNEIMAHHVRYGVGVDRAASCARASNNRHYRNHV